MIEVFRRTSSPVSRMFAQMWAAHNLSQWYSALINGATRAAYFRDAVGITPVTGIYRGFLPKGGYARAARGIIALVENKRRTNVAGIYSSGWLRQRSRRNGAGVAREAGDGVRVCTETQRKEKGGGILGTWIDAVLSNHVLRLLPLCLSSGDFSRASRVPSPLLHQWNPRPACV